MLHRFAIFFALLGPSALCMAQTQFTIFRNDGTVLQIPVTAIDSLTYATPGAGEMAGVTMEPLTTGPNGIALHAVVTAADDGSVTARGFCFGTAPDPTTADGLIDMGTGIGAMDSALSALPANTTYHVRAFATTAYGTAFSPSIAFSMGAGGALQGTGVTDIDGNAYPSVIIDGVEWMAMNLRTAHYANGDLIPVPANGTEWMAATAGASCSLYQFHGFEHYDVPYGKFYNWYAVTDPRQVCPAGWRMPTADEMFTLFYNHDPREQLSDDGPEYWGVDNTASNSTGFSAVPAGVRTGTLSAVQLMNTDGIFWTGDADTPTLGRHGTITSGTLMGSSPYAYGHSVRCVRN